MKIKELKAVMILTMALLGLSACGGFKVGLDDETLGAADCLLNNNCDDDSNSSDATDDGTDGDSTDSQVEGTNDSDEETGGGVVIEDYERVDGAYFLGTYQAMEFHTDYYDIANQCDFNFPKIIRGYSYDDTIDFETQTGGLAFSAAIYPDETFDFSARFQNSVGQPTIEVTCTCEIVEGYNDYFADEMQCGCESSGHDELCLRYWEKL